MPLLSATVLKEDRSSKLGIAFERESEGRALRIKLIRDDSLFAGSDLVPGLVLVSAAGEDMMGKTPKDAADALRNAPGGEPVVLVCKGAKATITKDKPKRFKKAPKLGVSFKSTTLEPGKVFISDIKPDSKFANTDLKIGHRVLAINGQVCPTKVTDAVELLKAPEVITITTIDPQDEIFTPAKVAEKEPAEERPAPDDIAEEKKEDGPESSTSKGVEEVEEDTTPEANKPLLDTVFGACIC
jgi:hypothetical protein